MTDPKADEVPSALPRLVIEVVGSGAINVSGPIHDKILSYGLLEMAKDAIRDMHQQAARQQAARSVIPARTLDIAERANALAALRNGVPPK